jgi:SAM-dependent methyltransferase
LNKRFQYSREFYEKDHDYLDHLEQKEGDPSWFRDYYAAVLKHSTPESRILDCGCGTGITTAHLHEHRPLIEGVDFSETYMARARRRGGYFRRMDLTALEFPDATFDVVCSADAVEHVPALERALAEMDRVLKPGGVFVLQTPNLWCNLVSVNYARTPRNILKKPARLLRDCVRPRLRTVEEYELDVVAGDRDACNLMSPIWLRRHFRGQGYRLLSFTTYSAFFEPRGLVRMALGCLKRVPFVTDLGGRIVMAAVKRGGGMSES